jgi:hypothetical protein
MRAADAQVAYRVVDDRFRRAKIRIANGQQDHVLPVALHVQRALVHLPDVGILGRQTLGDPGKTGIEHGVRASTERRRSITGRIELSRPARVLCSGPLRALEGSGEQRMKAWMKWLLLALFLLLLGVIQFIPDGAPPGDAPEAPPAEAAADSY